MTHNNIVIQINGHNDPNDDNDEDYQKYDSISDYDGDEETQEYTRE